MIKRILLLAAVFICALPCMAQTVWPGQSGNPVGYAAIGPLNDSTTCPAYSSGTAGGSACPSRTSGSLGSPTIMVCVSGGGSHTIRMGYYEISSSSGWPATGSMLTTSNTHGTTYSGPVAVVVSETLKAIGTESGFFDSGVGSAAYTISPITVTGQGKITVNGSITIKP